MVLRSVEKEREHRFADVGDLARQLKPFASTEGRDSVERVVRLLERRAQRSRSTRPPPLPANAPSRSIIRVGAIPADAEERSLRRRVVEITVVTLGIVGLSVGVGSVVAVRNLQATLAARAPVERSVVASLSPALTAPPPSEAAAASAASAVQAPVAVAKPTKSAQARPQPRATTDLVQPVPAANHAAVDTESNAVAVAKAPPPPASPAHGLFDDAN